MSLIIAGVIAIFMFLEVSSYLAASAMFEDSLPEMAAATVYVSVVVGCMAYTIAGVLK